MTNVYIFLNVMFSHGGEYLPQNVNKNITNAKAHRIMVFRY